MKVSEMNPEQIRVRVAELDGYMEIGYPSELHENCQIVCGRNPTGSFGELPDYTNSIDAINAAVLRMTSELQYVWFRQLRTDLHNDLYDYADCTENNLRVATASALDRAKAFVSIHEK